MRAVKSFEESPITKRTLWFFSNRIGQFIAPVGLAKVLAINSSLSDYPQLVLTHAGRSREFKTKSTELAMLFFSKKFFIYIEGETTIHGMISDYGSDIDGKCVILNDGNLLFNALSKRTKQRWLSAMSVILTERKYTYSERKERLSLEGRISLIINIPSDTFDEHKKEFFGSTLGNRSLILHAWMDEEDRLRCQRTFGKTMWMRPPVQIKERYNEAIDNLDDYDKELEVYAKEYGTLSIRSTSECKDIVKALASENARINKRDYLCEDDMVVVRMLKPYVRDPMATQEQEIVSYLKEGKSYRDICHLMHKEPSNFKPLISYYRRKAVLKGVLDLERS